MLLPLLIVANLSVAKGKKNSLHSKARQGRDTISNLRPLSLLETMYKIKTRILIKRMAGVMELILYKDQHGFCRNRSIQTASLPILEAIHDAERTGRSLQLLSIDLKAAFDTITPQIIYKVMQMEKFPEIYTEALKQLMETDMV